MFFDCEEYKDMIFFRDYLRTHSDQAQKYADLKKRASLEAHEQGEIYRKIKDPFMKQILEKRKLEFL